MEKNEVRRANEGRNERKGGIRRTENLPKRKLGFADGKESGGKKGLSQGFE